MHTETVAPGRKALFSMKISEFEIPPIQDVLLIGRRAPIGPEAVKRTVDLMCPGQYEINIIEEGPLEAVVVRKSLSRMISNERLLDIILGEANKVASETTLLKAHVDIVLAINLEVEL
ncbi:hypothetical protein Psfp_04001 [Pelotomaculum sp. FP]|uniref:hypothetical protein n=1 Tax=Pelotomaculum sp. FP TaxID=261474 RepID=UPI001100F1B9|nr:hypothetical protein [Pelotomaculum sp. FP]TEB11204.1 hypothetical protein Psfp_04001 [Pelotomaculum sp. FP]